jgi:hypothetical protein
MTRRDPPSGTIDLKATASLWSSRALPGSRVEAATSEEARAISGL